jgi:hypothetical protein
MKVLRPALSLAVPGNSRQTNSDRAAGWPFAADPHLPAHAVNDLFDVGKLRAGSRRFAAQVSGFLEQMRQVGLPDRQAVVADINPNLFLVRER